MKLRIFVEPQQGATYDQLLAVAQKAEATGFDAFFRSDHFLTMGGDGLPGPTDAWITLAGIARETERIRLGTLVTSSTFRPPGLLAVEVAQVDAMSGGRAELGLGAGWYDAEHTAYGFAFPPVGERFERLEEQFAILTGLWTTPVGQTFDFEGRHYTSRTALRCPSRCSSRTRRSSSAAAERSGRRDSPPPTPMSSTCRSRRSPIPRRSTDVCRRRVNSAAATRRRLRYSAAQVLCCGSDEAEVGRRAANIGRKPDELRANGVAGTPDEVVERLQAYTGIGAETVYLQVLDVDDLEHLDLVATEVMPRVA